MCGRYRLTRSDKQLATEFGLDLWADSNDIAWAPRYNIAPTDVIPVVELDANGDRRFRLKRWGLIPFWAKDARTGANMINSRSESVLERRALAESFRRHRVLVPADGFYEWKKSGVGKKITKQPYNFGLKDGSTFCFAGVAAKWKSPSGEVVESFSILTTAANKLVEDMHDRMPAIIPKAQYERWLKTEPERAKDLLDLLQPFDATEMKRYPVSQKVNSAKNDGPECIESMSEGKSAPLAEDETKQDDASGQGKLFG